MLKIVLVIETNTFDSNNTDIKGILEFSSEFALTLVDRLLGGNGKGSKSSQGITPIEQKVLEVVCRVIDGFRKQLYCLFLFQVKKHEIGPFIKISFGLVHVP